MARPKGTPKTGGRKKGTPNKTTAEIKELVAQLVGENIEDFKKEFKTLETAEKISIIKNLLPYVIPRQTETKHSLDKELSQALKKSMENMNDIFE